MHPSVARRGTTHGFTLVEVMVVVVMVGVLAMLATYAVRNYVNAAKTSEAVSLMGTIKAAEEAYKDETFVYLDVSGTGTFAADRFYPSQDPKGNVITPWTPTTGFVPAVRDAWNTLGVQSDGPVRFAYAVVACGPGGNCTEFPTLPTEKTKAEFGLPSAANRWGYVAVAKCNVNSDGPSGKTTYVLSHSYSNEMYVENEGQ